MRFLIRTLEIAILGVLSLACQQPTATPAPQPNSLDAARQQRTVEAEQLKAAYPGLRTIREAFPGGSFTIDAQEAATRGTLLLLADSFPGYGYDLERSDDGHVVLSFVASWVGGVYYFVRLQCNDEQATALRLPEQGSQDLMVVFRLTSVARPVLGLTPSEDETGAPIPGTVRFDSPPPRVFRGTLVAFRR